MAPADATELKPETVAAFNRYIDLTEAQTSQDTLEGRFLRIDCLPQPHRQEAYDQLRQGQVYIEELHTRENHQSIRVPAGLIHHWVGLIFIPNATLSNALSVLEDYDHQEETYKPEVRQSKLIEQHGNEAKIHLQFFHKSIVTVVLNVNFDVRDQPFGTTRYQSVSRSTRIGEVANFGEADEHELPVGEDHGYMWRLYTYWRLEEKDGGVYVQNETIELSRTIPFMLAWLVNPLTKSIPRDFITALLTETRNAVSNRPSSAGTLSEEPAIETSGLIQVPFCARREWRHRVGL